jgi:hypothetical protein
MNPTGLHAPSLALRSAYDQIIAEIGRCASW